MNINEGNYDNKKIGKLISWGGDHWVYEYGSDKVIKFSVLERLMGKEGHKKVIQDFLTAKTFFGEYVLETDVLNSATGKWYGAIQQKIVGAHFLTKKDLKNHEIKRQFLEIIKAYNKMLEAGYPPIDFIGRGGIFGFCLSNIFVAPNNRLFIFDVTLYEIKPPGIFHLFFIPIIFLALSVQNRRIKSFLKAAQ